MSRIWNGKDCIIRTFQNQHEKPCLELDGVIYPLEPESLSLKKNRTFRAEFIEKEKSFIIVKIKNKTLPIELANG